MAREQRRNLGMAILASKSERNCKGSGQQIWQLYRVSISTILLGIAEGPFGVPHTHIRILTCGEHVRCIKLAQTTSIAKHEEEAHATENKVMGAEGRTRTAVVGSHVFRGQRKRRAAQHPLEHIEVPVR